MNDYTTWFIEKDLVRVQWVELGEGMSGEYSEDDPDDIELLRFDVLIYEDGSWLDIIHWTSAAEAMQASERFMTEPGNCECMSMMDPDSIRMSHGELHVAI